MPVPVPVLPVAAASWFRGCRIAFIRPVAARLSGWRQMALLGAGSALSVDCATIKRHPGNCGRAVPEHSAPVARLRAGCRLRCRLGYMDSVYCLWFGFATITLVISFTLAGQVQPVDCGGTPVQPVDSRALTPNV